MAKMVLAAVVGLFLMAPGLAAPGAQDDTATLGRVFFEQGGTLSRSAPFAAGWLRTQSEPAMIQLDNGRVVRLAENSAAVFRETSKGDIEVVVGSGLVSVKDARGRLLTAGVNSRFIVHPASGEPDSLWQDEGAAAAAAGDAGEEAGDDDFAPRRTP